MSVNTTSTPIYDMGFNVSTRTLTLLGSAPDTVYENVLHTVKYLTYSRYPNIHNVSLSIDDGVQTSTEFFDVIVLENGMRRRREAVSSLRSRRRLLSLPGEDKEVLVEEETVYSSNGLMLILCGFANMLIVVFVGVFIVLRMRQASAKNEVA